MAGEGDVPEKELNVWGGEGRGGGRRRREEGGGMNRRIGGHSPHP